MEDYEIIDGPCPECGADLTGVDWPSDDNPEDDALNPDQLKLDF